MGKIINIGLLSNPVNWFTVALMVTLGGFGVALIVAHAEKPDAK
jgi:hypothetical protein